MVDVFGEGCVYCYNMVDTMNKLVKTFKTERKDIKVYKMNAGRNSELARRYRIQYYPTLLFFKPGDAEFPYSMVGRHDYHQVYRMAQSYKKQKSLEQLLTEDQIEKLCKPEVDQALAVYERELRESKLLLTVSKMKYYEKLEERIQDLSEDDKAVKKELKSIEPLEKEAELSEESSLEDYKNFRKEVVLETKERFAKILTRLESKITDMQVTLDNRDIVKREEAQVIAPKVDVHDQESDKKKKGETPSEAKDDDSFAYSWLLKHFLSFCLGAGIMVVYQRLSKLDDIVKITNRV